MQDRDRWSALLCANKQSDPFHTQLRWVTHTAQTDSVIPERPHQATRHHESVLGGKARWESKPIQGLCRKLLLSQAQGSSLVRGHPSCHWAHRWQRSPVQKREVQKIQCPVVGAWLRSVIPSACLLCWCWSCQRVDLRNYAGTPNISSNREHRHHRAIDTGSQAESGFNYRTEEREKPEFNYKMIQDWRKVTSLKCISANEQVIPAIL